MAPFLDYAGVFVFALTGGLAAARDRHDFVTFWFFAVVTGIGGGTLRDLLIGAEVFWVGDATYLGIGLAAALTVWFAAPRLERARALLWLDAIGLSAYSVIGASKALMLGVDPLVSVAMGVLTACFGGVIRDVLAGQPSVLLKRDIYLTAAILAGGLFVVLSGWGLTPVWSGLAGAVAGFVLRAGAIRFAWALPAFSPGRRGEG